MTGSVSGTQDVARSVTEELDALELALGGANDTRFASAANEDARLGVVAFPLEGGDADKRVNRRADEPFIAASTIKVYVLQALLESVAAGRHGLHDPVELAAEDQVTGSGVLKTLVTGRAYTLLDIATLMIVVSDNTATNLLVELLGTERINGVIQAHGWSGTHLRGKLQVKRAPDSGPVTPSRTTPRDLADYFARLWRGELLPVDLTEVAKRIYSAQQFTELGRALDYDQYSAEVGDSDVLIASKSGSVRGVRNDAGVVTLDALTERPSRFVVAVMTDGCPDLRFHPENLGARVVGKAAATVLRRLSREGPSARTFTRP